MENNSTERERKKTNSHSLGNPIVFFHVIIIIIESQLDYIYFCFSFPINSNEENLFICFPIESNSGSFYKFNSLSLVFVILFFLDKFNEILMKQNGIFSKFQESIIVLYCLYSSRNDQKKIGTYANSIQFNRINKKKNRYFWSLLCLFVCFSHFIHSNFFFHSRFPFQIFIIIIIWL